MTQLRAALFLLTMLAAWPAAADSDGAAEPAVLDTADLKAYVQTFNADDEELYSNIPNNNAFAFLKENIPLFDCPDESFERTYYFRWWTYRKHIRPTPDGYVVTEFLPKVSWSHKHNTISCPAAHHFYEGRWLHNPQYLDDYAVFWHRKGGAPQYYATWLTDSYYARHLVTPNKELLVDLLPDLVRNHERWEEGRMRGDFHIGMRENGLFANIDDRDGMEVSIGGSGYRATINSYMYGDARAIAKIARMAGDEELAKTYDKKAEQIKRLVQEKLWDPEARFFKVMNDKTNELADVREQHGYTPWYFNMPDNDSGYEVAWEQLMDPAGFYAPFGPTTAERRHPKFDISMKGPSCKWNGSSWPLSTSVTLTALANVLNNYDQDVIDKQAYFETLKIYTNSHQLKRENGKVVPWIDESLNPITGDWHTRTYILEEDKRRGTPNNNPRERGKDYNHSSYNDLIITGLVGLRPRADDTVEVNPLLPAETWDYFCLDNVLYHGQILTIVWDKTGQKYNVGKGLTVTANGKAIAKAPTLSRVTGKLPQADNE